MLKKCVFCLIVLLLSLSVSEAEDAALRLTVMTYNVLYGAGVNAEDERIANQWSQGKYHGNRLEQVISIIKSANPDIVGIQEACHWDQEDEAPAKQVANELGMHYFVGKSAKTRFHVALFSKLPIVSARTFPDLFSRSAIEAELKLPDGRLLHTFVGHFNLPRSGDEQLREIRCLATRMRPYAFDLGVMMGDANMTYVRGTAPTEALRASGFVMVPFIRGIDQIWTSRRITDVNVGPSLPPETPLVSDHMPVVAIIGIPPAEKD